LLDDDKKPDQQIFVILSQFMFKHDNENTLSIIYYAGHGWAKDGDLMLLRLAPWSRFHFQANDSQEFGRRHAVELKAKRYHVDNCGKRALVQAR